MPGRPISSSHTVVRAYRILSAARPSVVDKAWTPRPESLQADPGHLDHAHRPLLALLLISARETRRTCCGQAEERHGGGHAESCGKRHCDVCSDDYGRPDERGCTVDERRSFQDTKGFCPTALVDQNLLWLLIRHGACAGIIIVRRGCR